MCTAAVDPPRGPDLERFNGCLRNDRNKFYQKTQWLAAWFWCINQQQVDGRRQRA
jgi:hypothetical protein